METYGQILNIAMPIFLVFVLAEKAYGWWKERAPLRMMDTISSLSSGLTNVLKDVLGLSISILTYSWMVEHWALVRVESTVWMYVIAFIALDFSGFLVHWLSHRVNFFWNRHLIHHSSEEFNLACALRQSISVFVQLFTFFLLPAALLGVPQQVIAIVTPLHLFAQFWYHTVYIGRMGWLEHIIVTPSHHRVHHAINPIYIDKNYGNIFIIWDKLFGTFQEELPEVPPVYGITKPVRTWNPIKINFQHLGQLAFDAWHARNWSDKLRIWWMPTGWRPADVAERYPIDYIQDVYHFDKYNPTHSTPLITWSWVQFIVTFLLMAFLFADIARIGSPHIFVYGGLIFLMIFSFTELMDGHPYALLWEALKSTLGLYVIYSQGGNWFGINAYWPWASYAIGSYFILSVVVTAAFVFTQRPATPQLQA